MKTIALATLTFLTIRQAITTQIKQNSRELDKLALILFPTVVFYLTALGAI